MISTRAFLFPLSFTAALAISFLLMGLPASSSPLQEKLASTPADPPPGQLNGKPYLSVREAVTQANKDVCVSAHIFDVIELSDGTRFLDVCPPEVSDTGCKFTFVSPEWDRREVGDLTRYRDQTVHVRGIIRATHGRMGIVISHVRQFRGGPEKFRPNPRLIRGFDVESDRTPVRDPNLSSGGHHRSFMDNRETESLPRRD